MTKRLILLIALLLAVALVACTTAEPEVVEVTRVITETVEVEGEAVEVTRVVTEEVEVTRVVEVEAEVAPEEEMAEAPDTYPRNETLYSTGTQWGPPSSWNPWNQGNYAMGTIGLCYETLFIYDPLTNVYDPWLAEGGEWVSENVYELTLREGLTWNDGEPLTAEDVKFTFDMAQEAPIFHSPMWDWLESVDAADDTHLTFNFSEPLYQQWANFLYTIPIVPEHVWGSWSVEEITSGINENPLCSGPYNYDTHDQSRTVWVKNDGWWATGALGLDPQPRYIVDIVNGSNNVAMGMVLQGQVDLSNNFLPGITTLLNGPYELSTYYDEPPYMLSANTAWLLPNTLKPPMDDVAFRQALARAINTTEIVEVVYGNMVQAAHPTGLLPVWEQYIDQAVVDELGFTYDPDGARQILADAGYVDTDGDGFVETPDGSAIELTVIVPFGWSDWMEAARVISESAIAAGINLTVETPDYGAYLAQRNGGDFDTMVINDAQLSNTPFTYYNWMFMNPIEDIETIQNGNYGRYDNQAAFDLVDELDHTPIEDIDGMTAVMSELQRIHLTDMPIIPMWYNGMWSQVNESVWTNWPAAAEDANHWLPASWRGYWNMTGIKMLADLEAVPPAE